jgi:predicted Fe-Mo cluster-binding NifX family protein
MRVALTVWEGRISPVFDVSRQALIVTIENGAATGRHNESIEAPTAHLKIARLVELGVHVLICGAISEPLQYELVLRGIKVFGFVAGDLEDVLRAFLVGRLVGSSLAMPGCRSNQHQGSSDGSVGSPSGPRKDGRRWRRSP